ncbi:Spindle pole body component Spc42 [Trypanosoma melophagium]|uniref:Spindle pole body component Spc42 n=1 Tax=Trypanosoma melophagium TaxID=715481 RepID=UPI00351A6A67|nr:Spindle pole body component Spc42 [Trypanosoma melophagium]
MFSKAANCNACGKVLCQTCLERHLTLPGQPGSAPVTLCHACAMMVAKAQAEAEKSYQQRRDLMKMLDEQQEEMERLLELSSTLRSENERLLQLTEDLKAENEQLQMKHRVMEAVKVVAPQGTLLLLLLLLSPVASGTSSNIKKDALTNADTSINEKDECNGCNFNKKETLLEQRLQEREKLLDMRDATLQEGMKKVSADAARVAAQRFQLQEEERRLKTHLIKQFDTVFEEEIE